MREASRAPAGGSVAWREQQPPSVLLFPVFRHFRLVALRSSERRWAKAKAMRLNSDCLEPCSAKFARAELVVPRVRPFLQKVVKTPRIALSRFWIDQLL